MDTLIKTKINLGIILTTITLVSVGFCLLVGNVYAEVGDPNSIVYDDSLGYGLGQIQIEEQGVGDIYLFELGYGATDISGIYFLATGLTETSRDYCLNEFEDINSVIFQDMNNYCHSSDWYSYPISNGGVEVMYKHENAYDFSDNGVLNAEVYVKADFNTIGNTVLNLPLTYIDDEYNEIPVSPLGLEFYNGPTELPLSLGNTFTYKEFLGNDTVKLRWASVTADSYEIYYTFDGIAAESLQVDRDYDISNWDSLNIGTGIVDPSDSDYLNYDLSETGLVLEAGKNIKNVFITIKAVNTYGQSEQASNIGYMLGDVNRNGAVSTTGDALYLFNAFLNLNIIELQSADTNSNGDVSQTGDALYLFLWWSSNI